MDKLSTLVERYNSDHNDGFVRAEAEKKIRKKLRKIFDVLNVEQSVDNVLSRLDRTNLSSQYGREKIIEEIKEEIFNE